MRIHPPATMPRELHAILLPPGTSALWTLANAFRWTIIKPASQKQQILAGTLK
jgi:hypothetical protein